jgi:uncharacterized protein with PIN domain
MYFLDTSAFAKLYHEESGSAVVELLVEQKGHGALISRLTVVEIESVISIKVRTGELDAAGQALFWRRLQADLSRGRIRVGPIMADSHFQTAGRLVARYGAAMSLRTLDAVQVV